MPIGVQTGPFSDLFCLIHGKINVFGAGVHVLAFDAAGWNKSLHDITQILLEIFQFIERFIM